MKKIKLKKSSIVYKLAIGLLFFVTSNCFSQNQNFIDVITLKNGTVLRGIIIEEIPKVSIKIQTKELNIFVCKFSEIEKISKEENATISFNNESKRQRTKLDHFEGFYLGMSIGPAFPIGYYKSYRNFNAKATNGLSINFFDFTYKSKSAIGISIKINHHIIKNLPIYSSNEVPKTVGTSYLLGPVFSFPISPNSSLEFGIGGGLSRFNFPVAFRNDSNYSIEKINGISFFGDLTFSTRISKKIFFNFTPSYFLTQKSEESSYLPPNISTISFKLGLALKLD